MPSITIRNLDNNVKTRLRVRAAEHDRSMDELSWFDSIGSLAGLRRAFFRARRIVVTAPPPARRANV